MYICGNFYSNLLEFNMIISAQNMIGLVRGHSLHVNKKRSVTSRKALDSAIVETLADIYTGTTPFIDTRELVTDVQDTIVLLYETCLRKYTGSSPLWKLC
jgi:hypothetical protein